jgi:hypothetical protein
VGKLIPEAGDGLGIDRPVGYWGQGLGRYSAGSWKASLCFLGRLERRGGNGQGFQMTPEEPPVEDEARRRDGRALLPLLTEDQVHDGARALDLVRLSTVHLADEA